MGNMISGSVSALMASYFKNFSGAALVAGLLVTGVAQAQEDKALVVVNDKNILASDVALTKELVGPMLQRMPEGQRDGFIIKFLTEAHLLADAARKAGLAESPEFKQRMRLAEIRQLRDIFIRTQIAAELNDDAVRARYDELVGKAEPDVEVKARHILVKTKEEAETVIKELNDGADFAELAKKKSTGPSGPSGGLLGGFFGKGKMVPSFEKAAFALEPGTHSSEPVQTQFGFHVIKVEEKRNKPLPKFEEVKEQLKNAMQSEALQKVIADLRSKAKIEIKP